MSDNTKIEWADATLNYINGCSVLSPGCTNCYAMKLAGTRLKHTASRKGLTRPSKAGPVWTGEVRPHEHALRQALAWKRGRRIFWNAHGDAFHENVPDAWIDRLFAVCALTPQHTHMILTKRSARMREYFSRAGVVGNVGSYPGHAILAAMDGLSRTKWPDLCWPLPNVWLGVSVEDQQRAEERIPDLLATPAAVRFISAEPLLGPVDIRAYTSECYECGASCGLRLPGPPEVERCCECGEECGPDTEPVISEGCPKCGGELEFVCPDCAHYMVYQHPDTPIIDWVIAGGESGPDARPMHPDWARSLRDQCAEAGVAFHFKQWGEWFPFGHLDADGDQNSRTRGERPGVWHVWPDRHENQADHFSVRIGKKRAGRLLDGVTHDGMPRIPL